MSQESGSSEGDGQVGSSPIRAEGPMVRRLTAGAKGIRTLGPTVNGADTEGRPAPTIAIARERTFSFRHLSSTARGTGSSNPLCSSGESHKLDHRDRTASHSKTAAPSMRSTARSPPRGRSGRPSRRPQFEQGLFERSVLFWRLSLGCAMGIAVDRDSTIV